MKTFLDETCHRHPGAAASFTCTQCQASFCRSCVKAYGSMSAICSSCGSLCLPYQETKEKRLVQADQQSGFGLGDLQFALRFPLRESISLVGLSILFGAGLFSLPFFRLSGVGLLLGSIGLLPAFIAHALLFGCASLIIQRLESGRTDSVDIFDVTPLIAEFWEAMRITAGIFGVTGLPLVFALQYGFSSPSLSWLLLAWSAGYYPVALAVASISKSFFPS